ncbi:MAG TPA: aminotransferase class IV [Nitrososphaerales archaeon]|nr:aminotransferase class IV [Nitrososphaerales archaeon]
MRGPVRIRPAQGHQIINIHYGVPFSRIFRGKAVRLLISSVRKKSPYSVDAKLKSLNYMDSVLAKLQANAAQMDDAILLDMNGNLAEATGMNIFVVKGNRVSVPTTTASLAGITRRVVLDIVSTELGFSAQETDITPHDLYTADEAFLTGTGAGIVPIEEVDGRRIGSGSHKIVQKVKEKYEQDIREHSVEINEMPLKYL